MLLFLVVLAAVRFLDVAPFHAAAAATTTVLSTLTVFSYLHAPVSKKYWFANVSQIDSVKYSSAASPVFSSLHLGLQ